MRRRESGLGATSAAGWVAVFAGWTVGAAGAAGMAASAPCPRPGPRGLAGCAGPCWLGSHFSNLVTARSSASMPRLFFEVIEDRFFIPLAASSRPLALAASSIALVNSRAIDGRARSAAQAYGNSLGRSSGPMTTSATTRSAATRSSRYQAFGNSTLGRTVQVRVSVCGVTSRASVPGTVWTGATGWVGVSRLAAACRRSVRRKDRSGPS